MGRRRTNWPGVAAMARSSPGVWRLHPTLVAADSHLRKHAARRVPELKPDEHGHFEFEYGIGAVDDVGRTLRDIWIRYVEDEEESP